MVSKSMNIMEIYIILRYIYYKSSKLALSYIMIEYFL